MSERGIIRMKKGFALPLKMAVVLSATVFACFYAWCNRTTALAVEFPKGTEYWYIIDDTTEMDNLEASLYGVESWYLNEDNYITSDYYEAFTAAWDKAVKSYTFSYGSNATYKVTGDSVTVTSDGVVEPSYDYIYWYTTDDGTYWHTTNPEGIDYTEVTKSYSYSTSTVTVTVNGTSTDYLFRVEQFQKKYAEDKAWEYINANITDSMTDYEKFETIVKYPTTFDYSVYYSDYFHMMAYGGGDCWASTTAINYLCSLVGIPCHTRYAADDYGAGSGHRNSIALIDGTLYIAEAGYYETAPRSYSIYLADQSGYSYTSKGAILHYDGFDTDITVPEKIGDVTITTISKRAFSAERCYANPSKITLSENITEVGEEAFAYNEKLTELNISKSVTSLGKNFAYGCKKLEKMNVEEGNTNYASMDGVLFDSTMSILLYCPLNSPETYTVPYGVTTLGAYSFAQNVGTNKVIIPASVTTIEEGALSNAYIRYIYFTGDKPSIDATAFTKKWGYSYWIYYPIGNSTWEGIEDETFTDAYLYFYAYEGENKVKEASLTLSGAIGINFYFSLDAEAANIVLDGINGADTYVVQKLKKNSDGYYSLTYYVGAKNMQDKITFTVYDADGNKINLTNTSAVDGVLSYCVWDYLDDIEEYDPSMSDLVAAMRQYGLCAQAYFDYNAPEKMPEVPEVNWDKYGDIGIFEVSPELEITYIGTSMILDGLLRTRNYYHYNDSHWSYTVACDHIAYQDYSWGSPAEWDERYIPGYDVLFLEYSLFDICANMVKAHPDDEKTVNLMNSMYWYHVAAKAHYG